MGAPSCMFARAAHLIEPSYGPEAGLGVGGRPHENGRVGDPSLWRIFVVRPYRPRGQHLTCPGKIGPFAWKSTMFECRLIPKPFATWGNRCFFMLRSSCNVRHAFAASTGQLRLRGACQHGRQSGRALPERGADGSDIGRQLCWRRMIGLQGANPQTMPARRPNRIIVSVAADGESGIGQWVLGFSRRLHALETS